MNPFLYAVIGLIAGAGTAVLIFAIARPGTTGESASTVFLLCAASACLLGTGTLLAFGREAPKEGCLQRSSNVGMVSRSAVAGLMVVERVAYQRALEEVYWGHRIWPKDRPDPKPGFDAVMSRAQLERKVADYLGQSQLAADQRGSPITALELQAEMERMASHTKQPGVLRELFAALGNDPFVIAECLARPILTERLVRGLTIGTEPMFFQASLRNPPVVPAYTLPEISIPGDCTDTWAATTTVNAPEPRDGETAVWTGNEMIVWGGENFSGNFLNTGAKYNPATDTWTTITTNNAPAARYYHSAVWTGSEMIVWGGGGNGFVDTGGKYNPLTDSWTATSTANTPIARIFHTAIWSGAEMIVWGGYDSNHGRFNSGGRYNPGTDSWTATSTTNAPHARFAHTALWTANQMIIWGGTDPGVTNYLQTGGRYDPATDTWTPTSLVNVPSTRIGHTAVWTGSEMMVWGGVDAPSNDTNTGGRYNPSTDSWALTSVANAPSPRAGHTAVWTGSEMVIWAGGNATTDLNTGGRYNPATDSWTPTTTANAPVARSYHTAVWTGNEMTVRGGLDHGGVFLNTGGRYCAQPSTPTPTPTPTQAPPPTPSPSPTATPTASPSPTAAPTASPTPTTQAINLSTRMQVQTDTNVGIGGFIISGSAPPSATSSSAGSGPSGKRVLLRAIGPSLAGFGLSNVLADPVLELHGPGAFVTMTNDNWRDTQQAEIEATGIPPGNDLESAIVATLPPGAYTAIVRGLDNGTGVGLVEAYDLESAADAKLANISTRGFVGAGENVMIGGLIAGPQNAASSQMLVRAIGPSLSGVANSLQDPALELRNSTGALIASNDDWRDTQQAAIEATGIPPSNNKESAILFTFSPGSYTAIVRGVGNTTGVGLVEVFDLQ